MHVWSRGSLCLSPTKILHSQRLCCPQQLSGISMRMSISLQQIQNRHIDSLESILEKVRWSHSRQRHCDSFHQEHTHTHTHSHLHTPHGDGLSEAELVNWAQIGYVIHSVPACVCVCVQTSVWKEKIRIAHCVPCMEHMQNRMRDCNLFPSSFSKWSEGWLSKLTWLLLCSTVSLTVYPPN